MVQGGHFFSDVVWAAGVCWFSALALHHATGLDRGILRAVPDEEQMPRRTKVALVLAGATILVGMALASPYSERWSHPVPVPTEGAAAAEGEGEGGTDLWIELRILGGEMEISPASSFAVEGKAHGHGLPTSKIGRHFRDDPREAGGRSIVYAERLSGWFRELVAVRRVGLPWDRTRRLRLDTGRAEVRIGLPPKGEGQPPELVLTRGRGTVVLLAEPGQSVEIPAADPRVVDRRGGEDVDGAVMRAVLAPEFRGTLEIRDAGD